MWKTVILISGLAAMIIPATAQIGTDQAMQICRNEVRQDASVRFGSTDIEFRSTSVKKYDGIRDRVEGTFAVPSEGPKMHMFACSVNLDAGNLRWVRIDSGNVLNSSIGSANRVVSPEAEVNASAGFAAITDAEAMDTCRDVVRAKVYDHGYIAADFNSMSIKNTPGRDPSVTGTVTGETAGHENVFRFSCEVNRTTGAVKSVEVNGH
jgi:hypothetical protein